MSTSTKQSLIGSITNLSPTHHLIIRTHLNLSSRARLRLFLHHLLLSNRVRLRHLLLCSSFLSSLFLSGLLSLRLSLSFLLRFLSHLILQGLLLLITKSVNESLDFLLFFLELLVFLGLLGSLNHLVKRPSRSLVQLMLSDNLIQLLRDVSIGLTCPLLIQQVFPQNLCVSNDSIREHVCFITVLDDSLTFLDKIGLTIRRNRGLHAVIRILLVCTTGIHLNQRILQIIKMRIHISSIVISFHLTSTSSRVRLRHLIPNIHLLRICNSSIEVL